MSHNWTLEDIEKIQNIILIKGDLILRDGQSAIATAMSSIPDQPDMLHDWCNNWLHEKGLSILLNSIK